MFFFFLATSEKRGNFQQISTSIDRQTSTILPAPTVSLETQSFPVNKGKAVGSGLDHIVLQFHELMKNTGELRTC